MRKAFLLITGFLVFFCIYSCKRTAENSVTKYFVIKHAERYPGFEGSLTWYGRLRAGDLMRLLKDSGIQQIYVTPFIRTFQTADSLRLQRRIDTVRYLLDTTGNDLLRRLQSHKVYGKNILIVGHGNTVPAILRRLGAHYPGNEIPDSVFNLLFEIVNDHGKLSMRTLHYGRVNLPDTMGSMMK